MFGHLNDSRIMLSVKKWRATRINQLKKLNLDNRIKRKISVQKLQK